MINPGDLVLVRTYSAGVHIGKFVSREGTVVTLNESRILWRWTDANTLREVANHGVSEEYTRLSEPIEEGILTEAIEIIKVVSPEAQKNLTRSRWG